MGQIDRVQGGELLEEAFLNIIENSIKHSGGARIRISSEDYDNEVVYIIEDDGKGLDDEAKENVFERGFTGEENSGSGLGLYLVKKIVESYGGSLEVKDSELGGTRFELYLKKA